jgi:uncharacterized protein YbaP (TraB family)
MKKKKQTLLWQIELEENLTPSYLLGTVHARCEEAFININEWCAYLDRCSDFAAEIDLDDPTSQNWINEARLPNNQSMLELLPEKKYFKVRKIIKKASGLDIDQFQHFLPIVLCQLVQEQLMPSEMPYTLDQYLWDYARRQGKKGHGLETTEQQLQVLHKIPLEEQLKDLLYLGKNINKERRELFKMIELYATGDYQSLFKAAKKSIGGARRFLLYDRNHLMANKILALAHGHSTFFAIGAAHLGGQKGVLRLLKQTGAKLKPILFKED